MARIHGRASEYLKNQERKNLSLVVIWAIVLILGLVIYFFFLDKVRQFGEGGIWLLLGLFILFAFYVNRGWKIFAYRAANFYHGRKAEGAVWYELTKLSDEFVVFQDVKIGENKWNIDFVVLGPTGIFAIETKSHKGKIDFNGESLTHNGFIFSEKDPLNQAMGEAFAVRDYFKEKLGEDIFVRPVLVFASFWARMRFGFNAVKGVYVLQKRFLINFINSHQCVYSLEEIIKLENKLKEIVVE